MSVLQSRLPTIFSTPRPVRWTVADYHRIAETGVFDERRVELIEGEVLEMPPIGNEHRAVSIGADNVLRHAFGAQFSVSVQNSLVLSDSSEPEPDLVIARGHWRDFIDGLPLERVVLVVEISKSTLQNDLSTKAALYAKSGIVEYWVIDLINSELVVHRDVQQTGGVAAYADIVHLKKGETIRPLHAPDSLVDVADLLL